MKKITIILLFMPFTMFAQFIEIANTLCEKNKKALVLVGPNLDENSLKDKPGLDSLIVYKFKYDSEFAKRFSIKKPSMILFDKNMMALCRFDIDDVGWDNLRNYLKKPKSKDCLITANAYQEEFLKLGEFKIEIPKKYNIHTANKLPSGKMHSKCWTVQLGAFKSIKNAYDIINLFNGFSPVIKRDNNLYKVSFGAFSDYYSAKEYANKYNGIVKQKK